MIHNVYVIVSSDGISFAVAKKREKIYFHKQIILDTVCNLNVIYVFFVFKKTLSLLAEYSMKLIASNHAAHI